MQNPFTTGLVALLVVAAIVTLIFIKNGKKTETTEIIVPTNVPAGVTTTIDPATATPLPAETLTTPQPNVEPVKSN